MRSTRPVLVAVVLCLASAAGRALASETPPIILLFGTMTETTNPARPLKAELAITVSQGLGVVRIGPPLYGSGACSIVSYDKGRFVFQSKGPLRRITWTGTSDGEKVGGTYEAENLVQPALPERGSFALRFGTGEPIAFTDVIGGGRLPLDGKDYLVLRERNVLSLHETTGEYVGMRMVLNEKDEPSVLVRDFQDGSRYVEPSTNTVVAEWITNGSNGYYAKTTGNVTEFFDRFVNPLPWTKIALKDETTLFVRNESGLLELFDKDLKPLNIRSGKTNTGRLFWAKTEENVTSFYDEHFNPLNWHSIETPRGIFYATPHPKKAGQYRFFDFRMRELKKPSFWRKLAYGFAVGMMAYGQALQRSAETAPPATPTYTYAGSGSTTTTATTIGNTTFYNTYGPGGSSRMTSQRIGSMEFLHGSSADGTMSGTVNHIGPTSFVHLNTIAGAWNGSTQRIGNFAFHNLHGPRGQGLRGTSQRIGDFIFTTIR